MLVPRKAIGELQRLLEGEEAATFQQVDSHLVFTVGGRVLASKKIEGQFPAFEKVITVTGDKVVKLPKEPLVAAIRRVSLLSSERSRAIRVGLRRGSSTSWPALPISARRRSRFPWSTPGGSVEIGFNAQYLLDFLSVAGNERDRAAAQGLREPGAAATRRTSPPSSTATS